MPTVVVADVALARLVDHEPAIVAVDGLAVDIAHSTNTRPLGQRGGDCAAGVGADGVALIVCESPTGETYSILY